MWRRCRVFGTKPWRRKMSQTVERPGHDQCGCCVCKLDHRFLAPHDGGRPRPAMLAATTCGGV
jgi:hypothetical protein